MYRIILALLIITFIGMPAFSADQAEVKVTLSAHRVTKNAAGKENISSGDSANPGEIIEYRATYKNSGSATARTLVGTLPVPAEMEFIADTAAPSGAQASTDAVTYSAIPLKRKVKLGNGTITSRVVPTAEYTSLRWNLKDLASGASVTVRARMKIKDSQKGPVIIKFDSIKKSEAQQKGGVQ